mgnify:FL=1
MFNKFNATKTAAVAKPAAPSIISADMVVSGNLKSKGDIQVDGTVEGDITSNKLTISAAASVRGMIEAEMVVIAGEVSGQIKARQVSLLKTARVMADVVQEKLSIEPGAVFEGNCRHLQDDLAVAKRETVALPTKKTAAEPTRVREAAAV